jgi:S-DNA-T family DNA segregation ATPase FtsK/SpoIIIE
MRKGTRRPRNRRTAGRPTTRKRTGRPVARPRKSSAAWRAHGPDAVGLAVLFAAILTAFSLANAAGPVGRGIEWLLRGMFGKVGYVVPAGTVLVAIASFVRRQEAARIFVGTILDVAALAGLAHLAAGTPPLSGGYQGLASGGGALGAMVAVPLKTYVGAWAGALACMFIGLLGALIITKTPLRVAAQTAWVGISAGFAWLARSLGDAVRRAPQRAHPEPIEQLAVPDEEFRETVDLPFVEEPPVEFAAPPREPVRPPPRHAAQQVLDLNLPDAGSYKLPPLTIFRRSTGSSRGNRGSDETAHVLERTLQDFGVDAAVTAITRGPTVTRFEVELGAGVKVSRVLRLSDDIAYALGSPDIRLIAPIPGKSAIGVEVPNRDRELVLVGDVVHAPVWTDEKHPMTVALGKDIDGHPVVANLTEMPHLLIAGATGAGKSSCLNAVIASLLARSRPDEVRLVLVDPKMVELSHFAEVPHLLTPVVTHPKRAAETLGWVVREMERRYELLSRAGQRNIDFYNQALRDGDVPPVADGEVAEALCYIAVFIDELADLMMVAARQVEDSICRIAQMARAVGIHLVVATQRPSVDVVTGLIKANIPSRIAFAVASQADSRVVLDMGGAEKLVGHGDMLYLPTGTSKPRRVQGAYVTEKELEDLTGFLRKQATPDYEDEALEAATTDETDPSADDSDPLFEQAMELVVRSQMGSTSMLQRKLRVGFSRAGRLMDLLERRGVVGPQEGSKARAVLIPIEELDSIT